MVKSFLEETLLRIPEKPPKGPRGIGRGAIDSETSRSRPLGSFSVSGGLFLTDLSSSKISSMGG